MKKRLVLMMALSMALAVPGCAMAEESTETVGKVYLTGSETDDRHQDVIDVGFLFCFHYACTSPFLDTDT